MTATILPFDPHDFLWNRIIERDIAAFLAGREREMCAANIGRAIGLGLFDEIPSIRECWAEAARMKAAKERVQA